MNKSEENKIKVIIFDLDRTIFDWDQVQVLARLKVDELLTYYDIEPHDFWLSYDKSHDQLFQLFLNQSINASEYRILRYLSPLEKFDIHDRGLASQLNQCFIDHALNQAIFCQDAESILNYCKDTALKVVLLTNGPAHRQRKKIEQLNLKQWFDDFYISEEREIAKPSPHAFLQICEDLGVKPEECLMVGDDLDIDILPAMKLGFEVFWLEVNRHCPNEVLNMDVKRNQLIELIPYLSQFEMSH